ncbi:hypothetical protein D3C80_1127740 [compost metagenome]
MLIERRQQADHIDAGGDHGRRVDQGRHRRRAFHGVRQPGVQEELSRLAHGADEEQQTGQIQSRPGVAQEFPARADLAGDLREQLGELDRAEHPEDGHHAEQEAEVADAVDHEGLDGGGRGGVLLVPEADQQIRRQTHAFPAEEHLQEVGGRHQRQHHEGEQRQVGEEARTAVVLSHVAPGIEVNQRRHRRHHDQHGGRHGVHADRPVRLEVADVDEGRDVDGEGFEPAPGPLAEHDPRDRAREEQQAGRDRLRGDVPDPATEEASDHRPQKGGEDAESDESLDSHGSDQPFITEASSTAISPRLRKKVTRIARPTAASAAATVRTNMAIS